MGITQTPDPKNYPSDNGVDDYTLQMRKAEFPGRPALAAAIRKNSKSRTVKMADGEDMNTSADLMADEAIRAQRKKPVYGMKAGGMVRDGCAQRGKTKGRRR